MHEFSIAAQILDNARQHVDNNDAVRVERLEIEVGEASHVNPRQLATCMDAAKSGTVAAAAEVVIETAPPTAECDCGWAGEPAEIPDALAYAPSLTCPECDAPIELAGGDSCRLMSLTVTDEPAPEIQR